VLSAGKATKAFAFYVVGFLVPFGLENSGDLAQHLPEQWEDRLATIANVYQKWSAGPRGIEPRYTSLVTLSEAEFPAHTGPCEQRRLLNSLLPKVLDAAPALLVFDLAFRLRSCPPEPNSKQNITADFLKSIAGAAARTPIVLGQSSDDLRSVSDARRRSLLAAGVHPNGLILRSIITPPAEPDLQVGLLRLNRDFRRVPLEWPAYSVNDQTGTVEYLGMQPGLALTASRIARGPFPDGSESIDNFVNGTVHPYTTLIPESKFIKIDAAYLLCDTEFSRQRCTPQLQEMVRARVRGKIAILGWIDDRTDVYNTAVGRVPGMVLHANYIESLLDGRLLHAIPLLWQLMISLIWFAAVEWPFHVWEQHLERAYLVALLVFVVVAFFLYYFVVVNIGWYLALLPPSFIALTLRVWYQWHTSPVVHKGNNSQAQPDPAPSNRKSSVVRQ
jgi:hypothetical protein